MRQAFYLSKDDTAPVYLVRLGPGPVDLTGAASVTLLVRNRVTKAVLVSNRACDVADGTYWIGERVLTVTPVDGHAVVAFEAGDSAAPGDFECRISAVLSTGRRISFPNLGWIPLTVSE